MNDIREIIPLYPFSRKEAKNRREEERWFKSYMENCACARCIEIATKDAYESFRGAKDYAESIVARFGFDRVNWVLSHTIQFNGYDARFSQEQITWAKGYKIPYDDHYLQRNIAVGLHPCLISFFIGLVMDIWKDLKFYDKSHCYDEESEKLNYNKKVVVVKPEILKDNMRLPDYQLFCVKKSYYPRRLSDPENLEGRFLKTGRYAEIRPSDIIGVLKLDLLPEWARTRFLDLTETAREKRIRLGCG